MVHLRSPDFRAISGSAAILTWSIQLEHGNLQNLPWWMRISPSNICQCFLALELVYWMHTTMLVLTMIDSFGNLQLLKVILIVLCVGLN
jgi:hypothetical protein